MMTQLMAIVNATPDSFHAASRMTNLEAAIEACLRMAAEGADILDIGGESSRPGAAPVSEAEEMQRVIPLLKALKSKVSIPISIDTVKPAVAKAALNEGATLINDISGFSNAEMIALARDFDVDICVMHMQGTPQTMQLNPQYSENITVHLKQWFQKRIDQLVKSGIKLERIIIDPGIGFGKTVADNLEILHNLPELKRLGFRLLLGASRKSFLSKILNLPTSELLPATLAINTIAIASHVDIIRVHDVKEHRNVIDVMKML